MASAGGRIVVSGKFCLFRAEHTIMNRIIYINEPKLIRIATTSTAPSAASGYVATAPKVPIANFYTNSRPTSLNRHPHLILAPCRAPCPG